MFFNIVGDLFLGLVVLGLNLALLTGLRDAENDVLTIASVREDSKEEVQDNYTRREFRYNNFSRSFNLPDTVDVENISAAHKNGILNVSIPKKEEAKAKPARQIAIK